MAIQVTRVRTEISLLDSWSLLCGSGIFLFNTVVYYNMLTSVSGLRNINYAHTRKSYFLIHTSAIS
jgi:hypothetical protein